MSRRVMFTLLLASVLLVVGTEGRARSCVQRPLAEFAVIFGARIVAKLPKNKMIVALVQNFRGNETRKKMIIDYSNVRVWTDRALFERHSKWVFAFEKKARQYDVVLCKTAYIAIHYGKLSANLDGSGYRVFTLGQLGRRLADKSK